MNRSCSALALACLLSHSLAQGPAPLPRSTDAPDLKSATRGLTVDLWKKLAKSDGNLAFSPGSIAVAIAMTAAGAKGETQKQMLAFLHVDRADAMPEFGELCKRWEHGGKEKGAAKVAVANRLFGANHFPFEAPFLELVARSFDAPLERLDYRSNPDRVRTHINQWVLDKTAKRIVDLIPPGGISKDARLTLVNAVHFLGDWKQQFKNESTREENFTLASGSKQKVPTMIASGSYQYASLDGCEVVQLEYVGGEYAMLFVLPPVGAEPTSWLPAKVLSLDAKLPAEALTLQLPRFKVEMNKSFELSGILRELGIVDAFDSQKADFTGIANPSNPADRILIDEVYHKAFVRVDEKGTEAAAATAVVMKADGSARPPEKFVRFDRPFAFALRHLPSGAPLFVGKIVNPGAGS